jgi:hypothetical protein
MDRCDDNFERSVHLDAADDYNALHCPGCRDRVRLNERLAGVQTEAEVDAICAAFIRKLSRTAYAAFVRAALHSRRYRQDA